MDMSNAAKQGNMESLKVHLIKEDYPFKTMIAYANKQSASVEVEIVSDQASLEYHGAIARFDAKGKRVWAKNLKLEGNPALIEYDELVGETKIYLNNPNDPQSEYRYLIVDRFGKVK